MGNVGGGSSGGGREPSLRDFMMAIKSIETEVKDLIQEMISDVVAPIHNRMTGIEKSVQNVENDFREIAGKVLGLEDKMKNWVLGGGVGRGGNIDPRNL